MVKRNIYLFLIFYLVCFSCSPVNKLKYIDTTSFNTDNQISKGYYWYDYFSNTNINQEQNSSFGYLVFFNNGLIREGALGIVGKFDTLPENTLLQALIDYKHLSNEWGDYFIKGDTIYIEHITGMGMQPYMIEFQVGVKNGDSTIKILKNSRLGDEFKTMIYHFHPFSVPPDSTGYLNEKLQKKRAKRLRKTRKEKR